ncbi:MAG: hypothetical protein N4A46_12185, partial [Schleiferiaceae bacterium]|nr:hypothetical protein [Schleiferiaceae bacterium]
MNNIQSIPTYKQFLQVPLELIRQEKLPHAIILNATNGSPSIQIAKLMSLFLLCETQTACGECNNCKMVNNNQHPDILFSYPYFNQKTGTTAEVFSDDWLEFISKHPSFLNEMWDTHLDSGNKQQKIFVAESQRINTFLSLKPYMGKKKIVLVFQADSLVEQASNKLLKAIEEPA